MSNVVRVVTRGSLLALTQTGQLVELLKVRNPGVTFETVVVKTTGDRVTDRPLSSFRGTGVFVKELQRALLDGEADLAVHSLKDVPVDEPDGLVLAAHPARQCPWDLLLTRDGSVMATLTECAVVGTSSPRRLAQIKAARPDLVFRDLRGNLDTRLRKLEEGLYEAIVVAAAGMRRLGKGYPEGSVLDLDTCVPAVGQGALAVECRAADETTRRICVSVNDPATIAAITAERVFMTAMGGGCKTPLAAYAASEDGSLTLTGMVGEPDTGRIVRDVLSGTDADRLGLELAGRVTETCAKEGLTLS